MRVNLMLGCWLGAFETDICLRRSGWFAKCFWGDKGRHGTVCRWTLKAVVMEWRDRPILLWPAACFEIRRKNSTMDGQTGDIACVVWLSGEGEEWSLAERRFGWRKAGRDKTFVDGSRRAVFIRVWDGKKRRQSRETFLGKFGEFEAIEGRTVRAFGLTWFYSWKRVSRQQ